VTENAYAEQALAVFQPRQVVNLIAVRRVLAVDPDAQLPDTGEGLWGQRALRVVDELSHDVFQNRVGKHDFLIPGFFGIPDDRQCHEHGQQNTNHIFHGFFPFQLLNAAPSALSRSIGEVSSYGYQ